MNAEQKQRAKDALTNCQASDMAALLQEMIATHEPKPVARVTGYYAGYLSIATVDGRVLPAGTALYAAPPHQSEHHLEMVNTPAPSVPDGWRSLTDVEWMNIVNFDRAYSSYDKEEAVNEAVKRTEAKLKELNAAPTPAEAPADVARDAARLDWLDERNAPHGLGWEIIQMPAGNVHIHTLTGDKAKFESIRDAIDAAIERQGGES